MPGPAYSRLHLDERRRQLLDAGAALFAEHAFEEISMRQIAEAAGVSKALLYHYFPSKTDLFKAAIQDAATELQRIIEPRGEAHPSSNSQPAWTPTSTGSKPTPAPGPSSCKAPPASPKPTNSSKASAPTPWNSCSPNSPANANPAPPYTMPSKGGLATWTPPSSTGPKPTPDLPRQQLQQLLLGAFAAAITAAQQIDPTINLPPPLTPNGLSMCQHQRERDCLSDSARASEMWSSSTLRLEPLERCGNPTSRDGRLGMGPLAALVLLPRPCHGLRSARALRQR